MHIESKISIIGSEGPFPKEFGPPCTKVPSSGGPPLQRALAAGDLARQLVLEDRSVVKIKSSPVMIPFKLCLAKQEKKRLEKKIRGKKRHKFKCIVQEPILASKPNMMERHAMCQKDYMDMLAQPKHKINLKKKKPIGKICCHCKIEPCPPRIVNLSIPHRRKVWETWKEYHHRLPVEMIVRFDKLLRSGNNLDPGEARYYFKKLDRKKKKAMSRKMRAMRRKKERKCKIEKQWVKIEVERTAEAITEFIKKEPLYTLNYEQSLISDEILTFLDKEGCIEKPKRSSKCIYAKTLFEIADKLGKWIYTQSEMVDIRPLSSREELALREVLSIESLFPEEEPFEKLGDLGELGEGMVGEGYEGDGKGLYYGYGEGGAGGVFGQKGILAQFGEGETGDKLGRKGGEGEGEEDILDKLIRILSICPDDFLDSFIDETVWPGVSNRDVLEKLKELRDGLLPPPPQQKTERLEELMIEWALRCDPEEVDEAVLNKIAEVAKLLADLLAAGAAKKGGVGEGEGGEQFGLEGEGYDDEEERRRREQERLAREEEERLRLLREEEERRRREAEELERLRRQRELDRLQRLQGMLGEGEEGEGEGGAGAAGEGLEGEICKEIPLAGISSAELMKMIRKHDPCQVVNHSPELVCCLNVKIWAVWLLHITVNCLKWAKWIIAVSMQIKQYADMAAGKVLGPGGKPQKLKKAEWLDFCKTTQEKIVTWRSYCKHVFELTAEIIPCFSGKPVKCCPQCRKDHKLPDVVQYHECCEALAEAIDCAGYWHRSLDKLILELGALALIDLEGGKLPKETGEGVEEEYESVSEESLAREIVEVDLRKLVSSTRNICTAKGPCPRTRGQPCPMAPSMKLPCPGIKGQPCPASSGAGPCPAKLPSMGMPSQFPPPPVMLPPPRPPPGLGMTPQQMLQSVESEESVYELEEFILCPKPKPPPPPPPDSPCI